MLAARHTPRPRPRSPPPPYRRGHYLLQVLHLRPLSLAVLRLTTIGYGLLYPLRLPLHT